MLWFNLKHKHNLTHKVHDSSPGMVTIQLKESIGWRRICDLIWFKHTLWFNSFSHDSNQDLVMIRLISSQKIMLLSALFDSTYGYVWFDSHIQNLKNLSFYYVLRVYLWHDLNRYQLWLLFNQNRLIDLKHNFHT